LKRTLYALPLLLMFTSAAHAEQPAVQKVPGTDLEEKAFQLTIEDRAQPSRDPRKVLQDIQGLNRYLGSYPPNLKTEEEREQVYKRWLDLAADTEAFAKNSPVREMSLYMQSELYRQGHNLDVRGSADRANTALTNCLQDFPESTPCHLSASYFYLAIGPQYLDDAEKSLAFLRGHYAPRHHPEVEGGYVFLHIYRQDTEAAKQQIDFFLKTFPETHPRAQMFKEIRKGLEGGIDVNRQ